jgi:hypothetical protein
MVVEFVIHANLHVVHALSQKFAHLSVLAKWIKRRQNS